MKKALELILALGGMAYKKDLALGMSFWFSNDATRMAERKIVKLKNKGYVEEISKEEFRTPHNLIKITTEGCKYLATKKDISLKELMDSAPHRVDYKASDSLKRAMSANRVLLAMHSSGIKFFPQDKPKLINLANNSYRAEDYEPELLKKGIFYTSKEIREYMKQSNLHNEDTTFAAKFSGAYISQDKIIFIFLEPPGKNKAIKFMYKPMKDLINGLQRGLKNSIKAFRVLEGYGPRMLNDGVYKERKLCMSKPYALIISNGYEKVYASVIGNKYGKVSLDKQDDGITNREKARSKPRKNRDSQVDFTYYLRADLNEDKALFPRTFVIPFNSDGIKMLDYLTSHSVEQWHFDSKELFANNQELFSTPNDSRLGDLRFPGLDNSSNKPAIFMPVPELNMLRYMHESKINCSLVTASNLVNHISRSVRSDTVTYYTVDTGIISMASDVGNFVTSGRHSGRESFEKFLLENNLEYTENEYAKLPRLFNLSAPEFWKQVDTGEISYDTIQNTLIPHARKDRVRFKKRKNHSIQIMLPEEQYKVLKKYCVKKGYSMRYYTTSLIMPRVKELLSQEGKDVEDDADEIDVIEI